MLILTTYETDDAILSAIAAGASGYLLKAAPEEELLAGVRAVAAGEVALAPSLAALLGRACPCGRRRRPTFRRASWASGRVAPRARQPTPLSPVRPRCCGLVAQGC